MDFSARRNLCPTCGKAMSWGTSAVAVAGSVKVDVTTWHCSCGEAILQGKSLEAWNSAYKRVRGLTS